jgi:predicted nucleic acid-binding protein
LIYLLDTSALLAHYRNEPGASAVQALFEDKDASISIASITVAEFSRRMTALGAAPEDALAALDNYTRMFSAVVPIDERIARRAVILGLEAQSRIPLADALIAATAQSLDAVLVHRDPHFEALRPDSIKQQKL